MSFPSLPTEPPTVAAGTDPADDRRVEALARYGFDEVAPTPDLQAITRLAAYVAATTVSQINLLGRDIQTTVAAHGAPFPTVVPRTAAMCDLAVSTRLPVHTADARADPRFADNPFVTGELAEIRRYAASPLVTPDGFAIGTLCVADEQVGSLDAGQLQALDDLAGQVINLFELHRHAGRLTEVLGELDHLAAHDPLTGLANRRRFTSALRDRLAHRQRTDEDLLILGDLDGFKEVNDQLGHAAGDEVLRLVGERLRRATRDTDLVARIGGDEFAILCPDLAAADVEPLLDRLRRVIGEPMALGRSTISVGISVGAARPGEGIGLDELVRLADDQMYADKAARR